MCGCKFNCTCIAIITGILAGVLLGILYALGFVATGIIFWAFLALGALGALLSPLYATNAVYQGSCQCFCKFRALILASALGTVIASAIGLIVAPVAATVVVGIVLGVTTLFAVMLLVSIVCLVNCLCSSQR